jgi:tungstate transport system substrate-binding protein
MVYSHERLHDCNLNNNKSGRRLLHDRQQHMGRREKSVHNLKILFRGDKFLIKTYHTLAQPEGATPGAAIAGKFIDFVSSGTGQNIIADFDKEQYGEGLYNDAVYAKQYDD